ncbi:acyl dehydratase [Aeromicrobium sp. 636]|uniref:Acyl dehydratase n=1 Tax=Aeromicrobium senzhongii TaxID=2663859 RepID=A0A8I0EUN4_9ACTN|nr:MULTISPECIES: MaoC family dehydratase [Aeromicrobium]MBC9226469.1 acyl dehydratase [Aeromicrobium senzhongii]MCQ3998573.1 acyl dehydratase [Aeromicrobium sp. 636]
MSDRPEGPYFDDLGVGQTFDAPSLTLTSGRAATHQAILGGRLQLSLDERLSTDVAGRVLADPGLVTDVAIGQSTAVTRRVVANLFYRGLAFHRLPAIGDTLHTTTTVVGLRQNASRPTGLAALRITTRDHLDRLVLDFWRCAMLPLSSPDVATCHQDDLSAIGSSPDPNGLLAQVSRWNLDAWPAPTGPDVVPGAVWDLTAGDVVTSAPELARLTLNLAHVHHDRFSQPNGRLVYGGHAIGIASAQVSRTLPQLATVAGWHGCDHTGPVREGDTLVSRIEVEQITNLDGGLRLADLRVRVRTRGPEERDVLDWRPIVILR